MPLTVRSCRRISLGIFLSLFIAAAIWWMLWVLAASQFRVSIDGWITSGRASGTSITYASREQFGFPRHVVLRFTDLNWKNAEGISFHADQMDLSSLPWDSEVFDARFRGHTEIDAPLDAALNAGGKSLTLGGDEGRAHVVLDPSGVWKFSRVSLAQAKWGRSPDFLLLADRLEATATRPDTPPKDHIQPGLILTGNAENMTLPAGMPTPFGPKMAMLETSLRVMGAVPDFRYKDSVAAWNNGSGVVEFDSLHMNWGPLRMTAKGTIGFDDELQPEGAFSGAIGNHDEVLKSLMEHQLIPAHQAAMLNSALSLFAKPSDGSAKGDIEVPITVQLNGLFLGPVRMFVFPEIDWPKADAPAGAAVQ